MALGVRRRWLVWLFLWPAGRLPVVSAIRKLAAEENALNVHMVPHTHDDVGWRKTVEQYFYGWNNTIDDRGNVRSILTTVVQALLQDSNRVFTYVETKFFAMWWDEQDDATKDSVRFLIANRQLFFANGGWCMHDEATTHYMGMVDQTTLGHDYLKRELGVVPNIGWQLDPFGHSYTQAALLSSMFDGLYFGRIDYQDLQLRRLTQECEGLWEGVFWGLTGSYGGNYGAPDGFCFDALCDDEPLVGANVTRATERVRTFLQDLRIQADQTQGNHIMVTMGSDFNVSVVLLLVPGNPMPAGISRICPTQYMEAGINFANMDLLMNLIMTYQRWNQIDVPAMFGPRFNRINVFYSTPEYYTQQKYEEWSRNETLFSTKTDDFFPYSDCPNCFWTGYFVSRAGFKRQERVASSFLMAARQIEATSAVDVGSSSDLGELEDALGVVQHHDAVSGTAKQHVADDYSKRVQAGLDKAAQSTAERLKHRMLNDTSSLDSFVYCQLLNETVCDASVEGTRKDGTSLYVVVFNPLASASRTTNVRLPVARRGLYRVERLDNHTLAMEDVESSPAPFCYCKQVLAFGTGPLPPLGATSFRITPMNVSEDELCEDETFADETSVAAQSRRLGDASSDQVVASNGLITATFDGTTGSLLRLATNKYELPVSQTWGYYTSFDARLDKSEVPVSRGQDQNSGAYIFRPSTPTQQILEIAPSGNARFVNTSIGMEVHVSFNVPWLKHVYRVIDGQPYLEMEYQVGPIPVADGRGKEIVSRLTTPLKTNSTFYTDSNGRYFLKRVRNSRPTWKLDTYEPVAGNYYPINAAIYMQDKLGSLAVLVDRSQGGGSLKDGSLEIMVQRRTLADDHRGVDEAMNETAGGMTPYPEAQRIGHGVVIRGTHRIAIGGASGGASVARALMDDIFADPKVFVGYSSDSNTSFTNPSFSYIPGSLPPNVQLMTLQRRRNGALLVRLAHQYDVNEDSVLSTPAKVDWSQLFGSTVASVRELTLTANEDLHERQARLRWRKPSSESLLDKNTTTVVLQPMEIRTFEVVLQQQQR